MPIVVAAVALLGTAVFWYFRMRQAGSAANEILDAAQRIRGNYRRKRFLGKAESSPIAAVDDPVVAAVATLIALAAKSDRPSIDFEHAIKNEMRNVMGLQNVDEAFIFARWVSEHASDANALSFRFAKLWKTTLDETERADLLEMAKRITVIEGEPTSEQIASLRLLRDRLGLTPA